MPDIINMTITTPPAVNMTVTSQVGAAQSITGFGIKGDTGATGPTGPQGPKGDKGDAGDPATNLVASVAGKTGAVTLDKTDVGLSNVDNTSDANKPVSTATQTALNGKASLLSIPQYSFPYRNAAGSGEPNTNLPAVSNATTPLSVPVREASTGAIYTGTASVNSHAVNKAQMDAADALKVNKAGDTMTGTLTTTSIVQTNPSIGITSGATNNALKLSGGTINDGGTIVLNGSTGANTGILRIGSTDIAYWSTARLSPGTNDTIALGSPTQSWSNVYVTQATIGGVLYITGTGFPEGVVTAPVGSIYIDKAITNGASSWIKKSGTGSTGWQVLEGDTGWRQMKADWNVSPRSSGDGFVERLLIRRVGNRITLACYLDVAFGGGKNHSVAAFLPVGFRNTSSLGAWPGGNRFRLTSSQTTYVDPILETGTAGNLRIITPSPTHEAYSEIAWVTDHQWPTTLPGTPA